MLQDSAFYPKPDGSIIPSSGIGFYIKAIGSSGWGMHEYRLYMLDGAGELHFPHEFKAPDDAAAIAIAAKQCLDGRQMELWEQGRKVHCWGLPECPSECA